MLRFKSSHNSDRNFPSLGLPRLISNMENIELICPPNLEEVKNSLFSTDSNKAPGAFILGRLIHDNMLLTNEIVYKFKNLKSKSAWVAIKLDMETIY